MNLKILLLLVPSLALVSCKTIKKQTQKETPTIVTYESSAEPADAPPAFDVNNSATLVGQKLEVVQPALEAANIKFRIIEKDGESMMMTMDYLPDRLNLKIKDGVITEVSKG